MNTPDGTSTATRHRGRWHPTRLRGALRWLAVSALVLGFAASPAYGSEKASAAPAFKVLAFYDSDEGDQAHASFDNEAKQWFPQIAAENGFSWTATDDWSKVNTATLSQYQVVMFLDDLPHSADQQSAFQQYMDNGGAWMGFHVSAFNTDPSTWSWYHNTFLGTGAFVSNSWGPTSETLKIEDQSQPATTGLPQTITSSVSEWYSWANDLRKNPDIDILASIDQSSFPVGTDPDQTWYSGYYPIVWTNKNYKMIYANFGHNAMDYGNNTTLSLTFGSAQQDQLVINGLKWLGGDPSAIAPAPPISPTSWYSLTNAATDKCVDARGAASTDGTAIQQYDCNGTAAQQFQVQPTSGGYARVDNHGNSAEALDVTDKSTVDAAPIQLWSYSDGTNQQWQAVSETSDTYHFVNRNSGMCLSAASDSTADSVQLEQHTCNGSTLQSFRLTAQSRDHRGPCRPKPAPAGTGILCRRVTGSLSCRSMIRPVRNTGCGWAPGGLRSRSFHPLCGTEPAWAAASVVLAHGTFGNGTDNWLFLAPYLEARGYRAFSSDYGRLPDVPLTDGLGPITACEQQLSAETDKVPAATGAAKAGLVGHGTPRAA